MIVGISIECRIGDHQGPESELVKGPVIGEIDPDNKRGSVQGNEREVRSRSEVLRCPFCELLRSAVSHHRDIVTPVRKLEGKEGKRVML